jgi:hypothetical protein
MNKITITHEKMSEIVEDSDPVAEGSWRWGSTNSYVFEQDGKSFMVTARFHVEEGLQDESPYTAVEVKAVEIKTIKWVAVTT